MSLIKKNETLHIGSSNALSRKGELDVLSPNDTTLGPRVPGFQLLSNFAVFNNSPYWITLNSMHQLFETYRRNPVFFATIMLKAREYANMRIKVYNKNTDQEIKPTSKQPQVRGLYNLFKRPNVLQSRWEFMKQRKIFGEVCGNSFTYANIPTGLQKRADTITTLTNVWPQYMAYTLGGQYFDATDISEIVKEWKFEYGTYKKKFDPHHIMHRNEANLTPTEGLILGQPIAASLIKPLSNIEMAYESRNVMIKNRGMRVVFTSNKGDTSGAIALTEEEKEVVDARMKKYGNLEGQSQFFFSEMPLNVQVIDQDVRKLGLFDEIAMDAMIVCHAFGVPEILLKLYLQGATFENQEAAVRRLYQGTLIPEADDDMIGFNTFLGLDDTDFELRASYDHIPALQQSIRDKADGNSKISIYMERLFRSGAATQNMWLEEVGLPKGGPELDRLITEFEPEELAFINGQTPAAEPEPAAAPADPNAPTDPKAEDPTAAPFQNPKDPKEDPSLDPDNPDEVV